MSEPPNYEARLSALEAALCQLTGGAFGCPEEDCPSLQNIESEAEASPHQTRGLPFQGFVSPYQTRGFPNPSRMASPKLGGFLNQWWMDFGYPGAHWWWGQNNQDSQKMPGTETQYPPSHWWWWYNSGQDNQGPHEQPASDKQNPQEQPATDKQDSSKWWKPVEKDSDEQLDPSHQETDEWWRPVEHAASPNPTRGAIPMAGQKDIESRLRALEEAVCELTPVQHMYQPSAGNQDEYCNQQFGPAFSSKLQKMIEEEVKKICLRGCSLYYKD